jgi:hypothetical protein
VIGHPDSEHAIVIAGGQGYVICPDTRRCDGTFGGQIEYIIAVPEFDPLAAADREDVRGWPPRPPSSDKRISQGPEE